MEMLYNIITAIYTMLDKKPSTKKEKYDHELQYLKQKNQQAMIQKIIKRKIDLDSVCQKKDVHNILNSFLVGNVYNEDLFNEFWEFYFRKGTKLRQVIRAYASTINILIQKIINTQIKINQLIKGKQKYKQNHDYKNINMSTLLIQNLLTQNNQYSNDLEEMSKPFSFNFKELVAEKLAQLKNIDENELKKQKEEEYFDMLIDVMSFANKTQKSKEEELDTYVLTNQEKYYRFIVYILTIVFVVDLSTSFNKNNIPNQLILLVLLLNSLFQQLVKENDEKNVFLQKVQINVFQNRLQEIEEYNFNQGLLSDGKSSKASKVHKFNNYAYYLMISIGLSFLWDLIWLALMSESYKLEQNHFNTLNIEIWKYNHYILYATMFTAFSKFIIFIFSFQLTEMKKQLILSRFHFYLFFLRFIKIDQFSQIFKTEKKVSDI